MDTYGEVLHIPELPSPSSLSFYLLLMSLQVKVWCHLEESEWFGQAGQDPIMPMKTGPSFHPLLGILHPLLWLLQDTSSAWRVSTHEQNRSLSHGLTLLLETLGPQHSLQWVLAPSGDHCSQAQFPTSSEQPQVQVQSCWPNINLEQSQGLLRCVLMLPWSGQFQTALSSLPDMLHHTESVGFFASFLRL